MRTRSKARSRICLSATQTNCTFPGWHVIYTVPPHLKVSYGILDRCMRPGGVKVLPAFKLRDQAGTRIERNYRVIEQVVAARGDWRRLLADRAALDRLICASGGHLRDLLRLVAGVLTLAQGTPVPASTVDAAIDQLRTEFLPIADDEALWLVADPSDRVVKRRSLAGPGAVPRHSSGTVLSERRRVVRYSSVDRRSGQSSG